LAAEDSPGDGAEKAPDEERPRKPPDTGCLKLKGPGLLKTGILLIHLMFIMHPMISSPVLTDTSGDDNKLNDTEYEFVYTERDTMGDEGVVYMKTELCPMGGLDNILRFEKPVDSGGGVCVMVQVDNGGDAVPVDDSGGTALIKADGGDAARVHVQRKRTWPRKLMISMMSMFKSESMKVVPMSKTWLLKKAVLSKSKWVRKMTCPTLLNTKVLSMSKSLVKTEGLLPRSLEEQTQPRLMKVTLSMSKPR
jgi:hypothetical protein